MREAILRLGRLDRFTRVSWCDAKFGALGWNILGRQFKEFILDAMTHRATATIFADTIIMTFRPNQRMKRRQFLAWADGRIAEYQGWLHGDDTVEAVIRFARTREAVEMQARHIYMAIGAEIVGHMRVFGVEPEKGLCERLLRAGVRGGIDAAIAELVVGWNAAKSRDPRRILSALKERARAA